MSGADVPFSFFCSLLYEISKAPSHRTYHEHKPDQPDYPALNILRRWTGTLRESYPVLPAKNTAIIFKLLFPDEDHCRKFDMQETRLAESLAQCFGFNREKLKSWSSENSTGCLGQELKLVLEEVCPADSDDIGPLSIVQVDELLDELASTSMYTDQSIRSIYSMKGRTRLPILKDLFRTLSPMEAGFLTQIILKDLRPILYPLTSTHPVTVLLNHTQASVKTLFKKDAMIVWDPTRRMLNAYRIQSTLTKAAEHMETSLGLESSVPQIGTPVQAPRCEKGHSPLHALEFFHPLSQVWAEVKYDGERAQIHVELSERGPSITIFSKSKRNSTWDRKAIHDCIYRALGLTQHKNSQLRRIKKNVILDAEMVAFHGDNVDEFWRIRDLIVQTAAGIRGHLPSVIEEPAGLRLLSQPSIKTDNLDDRHLGLVFFDILMLDSKTQLMTPYWRRREILENLIQVIPGECILSARVLIQSGANNCKEGRVMALEKIFSNTIAMAEEGIVLKGHSSKYHDFLSPWVKLKKDYIPGYGDTVDLAIIAVGWEKERARQLRVSPSTLTTFFIGIQVKKEEIADKSQGQSSSGPHFEVYFTVSYGLSRPQLEQANFYIYNSDTIPFNSPLDSSNIGYTFTLASGLLHPTLLLKTPLLGEIFGAGFTKSYKSHYYEIRFPRLNKIYQPCERGWQEALSLEDLHKVACCALGQECLMSYGNNTAADRQRVFDYSKGTLKQKRKVSRKNNFNRLKPTKLDEPSPTKHYTLATAVFCQEVFPDSDTVQEILDVDGVFFSQISMEQVSRLISHVGSLIWFPQQGQKSTMNVSNQTSLEGRQIHSLHSLAIGCGWIADTFGSTWVERGVVFVDECVSNGKSVAQHARQLLAQYLLSLPPHHPRKKIWLIKQGDWTDRKEFRCQVL